MNTRLNHWRTRHGADPAASRRLIAGLLSLSLLLTGATGLRAQQAQGNSSVTATRRTDTIYRFSLPQALSYGAAHSIQVMNAILDYQIQEQTNRSITAQALPQVTGSAGFTDYFQVPKSAVPGSFFASLSPPGTVLPKLIPVDFGVPFTANAGATLRQILFDGQVFVGLKARQTALDLSQKNREITEEMLRVNINKVYLQLLLSHSQIELIDSNIKRVKELQFNATEMFKNGFAEQLDVDKATVQLTNLQSTRVQTLNNIDNGYLGLKVMLGIPIRDSLVLTDSLTYDMVREGALSDEYKYSDVRRYQLLEITRKLNEFDIQRYKMERIPTLSASVNYSQTGFGLDFSDLTGGKYWYPSSYFGLNLSVPIFDGFYKAANIRKSTLSLQQTQNQMDNMRLAIDQAVRQAQLNFSSALTALDFEKKNMELATRVYEQTRKKFEQGLGSNTEITTAQTDMIQAQSNYFNALYMAVSAKIDYQYAIGKL